MSIGILLSTKQFRGGRTIILRHLSNSPTRLCPSLQL